MSIKFINNSKAPSASVFNLEHQSSTLEKKVDLMSDVHIWNAEALEVVEAIKKNFPKQKVSYVLSGRPDLGFKIINSEFGNAVSKKKLLKSLEGLRVAVHIIEKNKGLAITQTNFEDHLVPSIGILKAMDKHLKDREMIFEPR